MPGKFIAPKKSTLDSWRNKTQLPNSAALSVEEVFAKYVDGFRVDSKGQGRGYCPFHEYESLSTSFNFNIATGLWICRSCGKKGNIYQFLKLIKSNIKVAVDREGNKSEKEKLLELELLELERKQLSLESKLSKTEDLAHWYTVDSLLVECDERIIATKHELKEAQWERRQSKKI